MRSTRRPPSKAACTICREAKIRCDGRQPCSRCSTRQLTCSYRPSQRGGIRRPKHGSQYVAAPLSSLQTGPIADDYASQQRLFVTENSSPHTDRGSETHDLHGISNLLAPFRGRLDLSVPSGGTIEEDRNPIPDNERENQVGCIRTYASDEDILSAYYIYIHPFLPILPPLASIEYHDMVIPISCSNFTDGLRNSLPHWPTSSLTLAISAILVLIPLPQDSHLPVDSSTPLKRSLAHLFAEAAFDEVDNEIDRITRASSRASDVFNEQISLDESSRLYPILALVVLSVYEYCQRGSISRMRGRANQAVTAAMDLSLHALGHTSTEAERRTWWSAILGLYLSSIDYQTSPIISVSDPRITTPFPSSQSSSEPWSLLLEAEQSLISIPQACNETYENSSSSVSSDSSERIVQFDSYLSTQIKRSIYLPQSASRKSPDVIASQNMRSISTLFIHCARIRLHRARAFMEIPMFLERFCDLAAIVDERGTNAGLGSLRSQNLDSFFPFTEEESSVICLKSALAISRGFETVTLAKPSPERSPRLDVGKALIDDGMEIFLLPFFACSAMQSSYVLLMCYYRLRAALVSGDLASYHCLLNRPEANSEVQDVERSMREIRQGLESILGAMRGARMFEGVSDMSKEIHIACQSAIFGS